MRHNRTTLLNCSKGQFGVYNEGNTKQIQITFTTNKHWNYCYLLCNIIVIYSCTLQTHSDLILENIYFKTTYDVDILMVYVVRMVEEKMNVLKIQHYLKVYIFNLGYISQCEYKGTARVLGESRVSS